MSQEKYVPLWVSPSISPESVAGGVKVHCQSHEADVNIKWVAFGAIRDINALPIQPLSPVKEWKIQALNAEDGSVIIAPHAESELYLIVGIPAELYVITTARDGNGDMKSQFPEIAELLDDPTKDDAKVREALKRFVDQVPADAPWQASCVRVPNG